jgi:septal ring factor EnvC (AmiA/AmiB activator)|tara:strand:+ start:552 stop:971 length:420 start_codon:yes stop_codon:yes gene_type:complete
MYMDIKIRNEIIRLKNAKKMYQGAYLENLEDYDEKVMRLESQIERAISDVKREILEKQKKMYLDEIAKIDTNMESTTKFIDTKLETLDKELKNINNEKKSYDCNIDKLNKALERRNANEIFDMFEYVSNALNILKDEKS